MSGPVAWENLRQIWDVRQDHTVPPSKSLKILSSHDNFLALYLFPSSLALVQFCNISVFLLYKLFHSVLDQIISR